MNYEIVKDYLILKVSYDTPFFKDTQLSIIKEAEQTLLKSDDHSAENFCLIIEKHIDSINSKAEKRLYAGLMNSIKTLKVKLKKGA